MYMQIRRHRYVMICMYLHICVFAKPYMHVPQNLTGPSRDTAIAEVWDDLSWSDLTSRLRDKGGKETSWTLLQTFLMFQNSILYPSPQESEKPRNPNT